MVRTGASVEWTVVSTEVEALQLEYSWIKEFDPRFNVKYRDDKSYPFLAVTLGEEFPRAQVMRGAKRKGTRYFGPYSHAWAIRETLDLLLRVFPMRTCSTGVFKRAHQSRPAVPARLHRQVLGALRRPGRRRGAPADRRGLLRLHGRQHRQVHQAARAPRCSAASDAQDYEQAARLRDDLGALNKALEKTRGRPRRRAPTPTCSPSPTTSSRRPSRSSTSAAAGSAASAAGWSRRRARTSPEARRGHLLQQVYGDQARGERPVPREVLVPILPADPEALARWLGTLRGAQWTCGSRSAATSGR